MMLHDTAVIDAPAISQLWKPRNCRGCPHCNSWYPFSSLSGWPPAHFISILMNMNLNTENINSNINDLLLYPLSIPFQSLPESIGETLPQLWWRCWSACPGVSSSWTDHSWPQRGGSANRFLRGLVLNLVFCSCFVKQTSAPWRSLCTWRNCGPFWT